MNTLERILLAVPPQQWKVRDVWSSDWYDGPREGACALADPPCEFYFQLIAERHNPNGCDHRLFRLSELPPGSVQGLRELDAAGLSPDAAVREVSDQRLQRIVDARRPTSLVVQSIYMQEFVACWDVFRVRQGATDWFAYLNIPPAEPTPVA